MRRTFSPPIDEAETAGRIHAAEQVASYIIHGRISPAVSTIYLFGSTERHEARKSSDVDLAVVLTHVPDLEIERLSLLVTEDIRAAKKVFDINPKLQINAALIDSMRFDENWEGPYRDSTDELVETLQTEGIVLASK